MKNYKFKINGNNYAVEIQSVEGNEIKLELNGSAYTVEVDREIKQSKTPKLVRSVDVPSTDNSAQTAKTAAPTGANTAIKSPLPGTILDILVNVGDKVSVGQKMLVLEAMKMENGIDSDVAGVVKEIKVRKGDSVLEGDVLLVIGE